MPVHAHRTRRPRRRLADMLGFEVARNEPQPLWWAQVELIPATVGWLPSEAATCRVPAVAWLETGTASVSSGLPAAAFPSGNRSRRFRCSSSESILTRDRTPRRCSTARATRRRAPGACRSSPTRASCWRSRHGSNRGVGRSKARRARARCWRSSSSRPARRSLDVPPTLSARARLLDAGRNDKTDAHDARSAAIVALRHSNLRTVVLEDHRRCCGCSRNVTTTWSRIAPGRSVGCTPCCASWSRADCPSIFRRNGPRPSSDGSVPPTRSGSNANGLAVELLDEVRRRGP